MNQVVDLACGYRPHWSTRVVKYECDSVNHSLMHRVLPKCQHLEEKEKEKKKKRSALKGIREGNLT